MRVRIRHAGHAGQTENSRSMAAAREGTRLDGMSNGEQFDAILAHVQKVNSVKAAQIEALKPAKPYKGSSFELKSYVSLLGGADKGVDSSEQEKKLKAAFKDLVDKGNAEKERADQFEAKLAVATGKAQKIAEALKQAREEVALLMAECLKLKTATTPAAAELAAANEKARVLALEVEAMSSTERRLRVEIDGYVAQIGALRQEASAVITQLKETIKEASSDADAQALTIQRLQDEISEADGLLGVAGAGSEALRKQARVQKIKELNKRPAGGVAAAPSESAENRTSELQQSIRELAGKLDKANTELQQSQEREEGVRRALARAEGLIPDEPTGEEKEPEQSKADAQKKKKVSLISDEPEGEAKRKADQAAAGKKQAEREEEERRQREQTNREAIELRRRTAQAETEKKAADEQLARQQQAAAAAKAKAEQERLVNESRNQANQAAREAEANRKTAEAAELARREREQEDAARQQQATAEARAQTEKERLATAERERLAKEVKQKAENEENAKAERERLAREAREEAEQAKREKAEEDAKSALPPPGPPSSSGWTPDNEVLLKHLNFVRSRLPERPQLDKASIDQLGNYPGESGPPTVESEKLKAIPRFLASAKKYPDVQTDILSLNSQRLGLGRTVATPGEYDLKFVARYTGTTKAADRWENDGKAQKAAIKTIAPVYIKQVLDAKTKAYCEFLDWFLRLRVSRPASEKQGRGKAPKPELVRAYDFRSRVVLSDPLFEEELQKLVLTYSAEKLGADPFGYDESKTLIKVRQITAADLNGSLPPGDQEQIEEGSKLEAGWARLSADREEEEEKNADEGDESDGGDGSGEGDENDESDKGEEDKSEEPEAAQPGDNGEEDKSEKPEAAQPGGERSGGPEKRKASASIKKQAKDLKTKITTIQNDDNDEARLKPLRDALVRLYDQYEFPPTTPLKPQYLAPGESVGQAVAAPASPGKGAGKAAAAPASPSKGVAKAVAAPASPASPTKAVGKAVVEEKGSQPGAGSKSAAVARATALKQQIGQLMKLREKWVPPEQAEAAARKELTGLVAAHNLDKKFVIKEFGVKGEFGYHEMDYPNEDEDEDDGLDVEARLDEEMRQMNINGSLNFDWDLDPRRT